MRHQCSVLCPILYTLRHPCAIIYTLPSVLSYYVAAPMCRLMFQCTLRYLSAIYKSRHLCGICNLRHLCAVLCTFFCSCGTYDPYYVPSYLRRHTGPSTYIRRHTALSVHKTAHRALNVQRTAHRLRNERGPYIGAARTEDGT